MVWCSIVDNIQLHHLDDITHVVLMATALLSLPTTASTPCQL